MLTMTQQRVASSPRQTSRLTAPHSQGRAGTAENPPRPFARLRATSPRRGQNSPFSRFFRDRRAVGTALTAAMFTIMSLGGIALAGDHIYLVYQRDILKAAADAAGIAASRSLRGLDSSMRDAQVEAALTPIARRYILANIPEGKRERVAETLVLDITPNRAAGTVHVDARADLGGIVFARWMGIEGGSATRVLSGVERVGGLTEVVLAIDVTKSMEFSPDRFGNPELFGKESRMQIVKRASSDLIDTLTASDDGSVAIGLVPWSSVVRLDTAMRTRWEDNRWAWYPRQRFYEYPYAGSTQGEWHTLPSPKPEAWAGCVEQRYSDPNDIAASTTTLPSREPFSMSFYTPTLHVVNNPYAAVSFQCHDDKDKCADDKDLTQCYCYDNPKQADFAEYKPPQFVCQENSDEDTQIVPLTTDGAKIRGKIDNLSSPGRSTYSTLGVVWGQRLLAPEWRPIWGDETHPIDPAAYPSAQKALVLLTDGDDTHISKSDTGMLDIETMREQLLTACTAAKQAGIKVFTIAALDVTERGFADTLEQCSSQADDPSGQYVFVNNATPEALEGAFRQIAQNLQQIRRIY